MESRKTFYHTLRLQCVLSIVGGDMNEDEDRKKSAIDNIGQFHDESVGDFF